MKRSVSEVLDGAQEAIYITDMERNLLYANRKARELGKSVFQKEFSDAKCHEVLLGRSMPCPFCRLEQLSDKEYTVRNFSGATGRVFEIRGKLMEWDGIPAHIEYIRDITAQRKAEKQSEVLALQQQKLCEHIGIGMCQYRFYNGELRAELCNSAYRKIFELPDEFDTGEAVNLQLKNFIAADKNKLRAELLSHIRKSESFHRVYQLRDLQTGLPRSILMNVECVSENEGNALVYVTAYDVTEWIESENRLHHVLNAIDGGIAVYQVRNNCDPQILFYTDGLPAMHGLTAQEYDEQIKQGIFNMIYSEDVERLKKDINRTLSQKEKLTTVYRVVNKEHGLDWVNFYAAPVGQDSEGNLRYIVVYTKVSKEFSLYQEMLNISNNGLVVTDQTTHEVYFANRVAQRILRELPDMENVETDNAIFPSDLSPTNMGIRKETIAGKTYQIYPHTMEWMGRPSIAQYFSDISEEIELREELRNGERRYRAVVEESRIAFMDFCVQEQKSYANELFQRYAIYAEVENERSDFAEKYSGVHPDDLPIMQEFYREVEEHDRAAVKEIRLKMKDGSFRWSELHGMYIRDSDGNVTHQMCFTIDIDDRVRLYQQLESKYEAELTRLNVFDEGALEKISIDLTDNKVLQVSRPGHVTVEEIIGKTVEDLLQIRFTIESDENTRRQIAAFMNREVLLHAYETSDSPVLKTKSWIPGFKERHYIRSSAQMAKNPVNGHIIAFLETRDVDKERTEVLLMRRLLETNYETAFLLHSDTGKIKIGITAGDEKFTTDITSTYDELTMHDIEKTVLPENQAQVKKEMALSTIRERLKTSSLCSGRTARKEHGSIAYKQWTAAYFDENKDYILFTTANVTDVYQKDLENATLLQEALDAAEIASQAKTTFLARMSHEIRTPITTVAGILELIRQDCKDHGLDVDLLLSRVDTASIANRYLLTLINDILDITKIESNELTITSSVTDIKQVISSIVAMIRTQTEKKGIHLELSRLTSRSDWYYMDSVRVSQILMNLLSNAVKFTPEGGTIRFSGKTEPMDENTIRMIYSVSDTGVGIDDQFKPDVFTPFRQEYSDKKSGYGGTGIGLSISRSLARLMGGDITFESEKGKGSVFTVTMKLKVASPQKEEKPLRQNADCSLDGITVLLCEDNNINQMIAKQLLERQGCNVLTANNGQEGVDLFRQSAASSIHVILMDVRMPVMDGLEATRQIRSLNRQDAQTVSIIAMSANAYEEDRQLSLAAGMNDHLSKPVEPEKLYHTIQEYLGWQSGADSEEIEAEALDNE